MSKQLAGQRMNNLVTQEKKNKESEDLHQSGMEMQEKLVSIGRENEHVVRRTLYREASGSIFMPGVPPDPVLSRLVRQRLHR